MADELSLVKMLEELEVDICRRAEEEVKRADDWEKKQVAAITQDQEEIAGVVSRITRWNDTVGKVQGLLETTPMLPETGLPDLTAAIAATPSVELTDKAKSLLDQLDESEAPPTSLTIPEHSLFAPTRGIFLQEIIPPPGADGKTDIQDLCWTPEGALLVARWGGKQLVKIELHPETLSMTKREVLYEGEGFSSVSCGRDGSWGAVVWKDHIKLHQPGSSSCQKWKPAEVPRPAYLTHYKDEMWVNPNGGGPVRVYGRDLNLRRTINVDENKNELQAITVSDGRLIATTASYGHYLHILSLSDESLVTVGGEGKEDGKFNMPVGVTTDTTGHILVCDFYNKRVSVFTPSGLFLHHLDLERGDKDCPWAIAVRERVGKPDLIALSSPGRIRIYELY